MTDAKVQTLYDKYRDSGNVAHLSERVEQLRKKAVLVGAGATLSFLFINETVRFAFRSPLIKLKPISALVVILGPTAFAKYLANNDIDADVRNLWRIHKTREENGLGGTFRPSGEYYDKINFRSVESKMPLQLHLREALLGHKYDSGPDTRAFRTNPDYYDFPSWFNDWDRAPLPTELDNVERLKPFQAKEGTTKFCGPVQPYEDSDSKWQYSTADLDFMHADNPDPAHGPKVDHGVDEKFIWTFNKSGYNQDIIMNKWLKNPFDAATDSHTAIWAEKLICQEWYTNAKWDESVAQRISRIGFDELQLKWALLHTIGYRGDSAKEEERKSYEDYIDNAYFEKVVRDSSDIYVEDEKAVRRLHTSSSAEDQDYFNIRKKIELYNNDAQDKLITKPIQRSPLEAKVNRFTDVLRKAKGIINEKTDYDSIPFTKEYLSEKITGFENAFKNVVEPTAQEELGHPTEDEFFEKYDDVISQILEFTDEVGANKDLSEVAAQLKSEISTDYNYVDDLQSAYQKSLSTPLRDQIYSTIPAHAFIQYKVPLFKPLEKRMNKYNPSRPLPAYTFWEHRANEEYFDRQKNKDNTRTSISLWRTY